LWYVIRDMDPLRRSRKIVFVVTDGEPDSVEDAQAALKAARNLGMEVYGLGLGSQSVLKLMPGRSVVLANLMDLPRELFGLLGRAMTINCH
jgi:hypothetical protein